VSNEWELFGKSDIEKEIDKRMYEESLKAMNATDKEHIIAFLDAIRSTSKNLNDRPHREVIAEELQNSWKSHQQQTIFISRFFKDDTSAKLSLINDNVNTCSLLNGPFDSEIEVIIALDALIHSDGLAGVKLLIGKLRNQFNSSNYRTKNKDAKQINSMIPNDLIEKLDKTAANKGIKRNELIVRLLREGLKSKT
jgi:hypothetical protein